MSKISEVVEAASMELASTGSVKHLFTTCRPGGSVNASGHGDKEDCTACDINAIAAEIRAARLGRSV